MTAGALIADFLVESGKILAEQAAGNITERQATERLFAVMDRLKVKQKTTDEALAEINAKWLAAAAALPQPKAPTDATPPASVVPQPGSPS